MFFYTVRCEFDDGAIADRWLDWMRREHLRDVCAAGALSGTALRLDGQPTTCECRYEFESRTDFEAYERDHAPRLRQEGLELFPPELGLRYSRSTAEGVARAERGG